MDAFEIQNTLKTVTLLVDTREQITDRYLRRIEDISLPYDREALDYADYSARLYIDDEQVDLTKIFSIERKMDLDELCLCFGRERKRFKAEFERAKKHNCRVYLLVENATLEHVLLGKYRSRYSKEALLASLLAWIPRYNIIPIFCKEESTGRIIREIVYRECKEYLERLGEIL